MGKGIWLLLTALFAAFVGFKVLAQSTSTNEILIIIGEKTIIERRDQVEQFMSANKITCHVIGNVWAYRTPETPQAILAKLAGSVGPNEQIVVAPISDGWSERNTTSRIKCFP
jgi:hypothetical protein